MDSALTALTDRYRASLGDKCAEVARVYQASLLPGHGVANRVLLQGLLHKLAGSAGAYGFAEIGDAARAACALIESNRNVVFPAAMDRERSLRLAASMNQLHQSFQPVIGEPGVQRLLLVEDDADFALLISAQLEREHFAVHALTDAAGLGASLALVMPDLLLLDFHLRDETAAELVGRLAAEGVAAPATVCLTADPSPDLVARARAAGMIEVFAKATPVPRLAEQLRRCLRGSRSA